MITYSRIFNRWKKSRVPYKISQDYPTECQDSNPVLQITDVAMTDASPHSEVDWSIPSLHVIQRSYKNELRRRMRPTVWRTFANKVPWQTRNTVFGSTVSTETRPALRAWRLPPLKLLHISYSPSDRFQKFIYYQLFNSIWSTLSLSLPFFILLCNNFLLRKHTACSLIGCGGVSEIHSLHLKFFHCVLTPGNVIGGNVSENILSLCSGFASCCVFILLVWHYRPAWALASSTLRLQSSLFSADLLHFLQFIILLVSLSTESYHLPLSLPNGLLPPMYPFSASWEPFHPSSPSHGLPTGIFSISYSWLAPFTCISY
jgi:hypothetical protein